MPQQKASSFADDLASLQAGSFADDLAALSNAPPAAEKSAAPRKTQNPYVYAAKKLAGLAMDHPVQAGSIIGGVLAAPLSGGTSLLPAMAASGLGAAGGAGYGVAVDALRHGPSASAATDAKTVAKEGVLGAAGEGVGRAAAGAVKLAGRGLYRAGLLPINQILGKYGDVVKTGVEEMVPVTKGGGEKAAGIRLARSAAKKDALSAADQRVTFRAKGIADDALSQLDDNAASLKIAGEGDPSPFYEKRMQAFTGANPDGVLTPTRLERAKSTMDYRLGGAYTKIRKREVLTPREEARMALSQAASRAQESAVPGYRGMNKGIMDAVGLEKAIQRRTVGSGGNQGLENAMTMLGGASALPARLAMLPSVLSSVGIGAYQAGKAGGIPLSAAMKTALIAALGAPD